MRKTIIFTIMALFFSKIYGQNSFLSKQEKYSRVKTAISEKGEIIKTKLSQNNININTLQIIIIAYKVEKKLDIYAKNTLDKKFELIHTYDICTIPGELGPKRKQGDLQVPEGFYHINRFNHVSNFYLSLGINYPNQSDRKKSSAKDLGGDIFIHGDCVSIGCLPMTDDKIKEIYLYAVYARNSGQQNIPVYIFPFKMDNLEKFTALNPKNPNIGFWNNLKEGYDKFMKEKTTLKFSINKDGNYEF